MRTSLISMLVILSACSAPEVVVKGKVFASHDSTEPLAGAKITIVDEQGGKYSDAKADSAGKFEAMAPEGEYIHAEISGGDGFETTSFTGPSGLSEVFRVEDGTLYGFSTAERDALEVLFGGCPEFGTPGGVVFGEIRVLELSQDGEHPVASGIAEVVTRNQKTTWKACYLNEAEDAWDPAASETGLGGRFAIFGIEPGTHILTVGWEFAPDLWSYSDTYVRVIEDGVAPRFPAWVEWPEF